MAKSTSRRRATPSMSACVATVVCAGVCCIELTARSSGLVAHFAPGQFEEQILEVRRPMQIAQMRTPFQIAQDRSGIRRVAESGFAAHLESGHLAAAEAVRPFGRAIAKDLDHV